MDSSSLGKIVGKGFDSSINYNNNNNNKNNNNNNNNNNRKISGKKLIWGQPGFEPDNFRSQCKDVTTTP